jgi:hypothetical protein
VVVVVAMSEWSDILPVALSKHHQTGVDVVSSNIEAVRPGFLGRRGAARGGAGAAHH